ncbi:MAG: hypothetical protein F6K40_06530 [Okeania sp. SIO3I5]|nr:hypothetical protein [Okeania sp. SIO3I5]
MENPNIGLYACPFDDEGLPTMDKTFIEAGAVKSFDWDKKRAALAGCKSTGSFRNKLSQSTSSLVKLSISPGQTSENKLISSIKEGLIVDRLLGASQLNKLAGEFSVNLDLGYKVENAQIIGRVKNTIVAVH